MIHIGMVGSGFAAKLHLDSYRQVGMRDARLLAICSKDADLRQVADAWDIPRVYTDFEELLADPEIHLVDIITPPALHREMIIRAMEAGKDVICEKPLTGFFEPAVRPDRQPVPGKEMYEKSDASLRAIGEAMQRTGKRLFYAENYVYAPSVQKCAELLRQKKSKILLIKGEESHSGSHAAHAPYWKLNGGGALIRQGCHPLSAALYLKGVEAKARGEAIRPVSVTAVTGRLSDLLKGDEHRYIAAHPFDVEDFADVLVTFSDGSIAQILASDNTVGGTRNNMEVYTGESNYQCNIAPNSAMMVFHENADHLEDVYMTEKLGQKAGWQSVFLEETVMRGYLGEIRDFLGCIQTGKEPEAGFPLARDAIRIIYAAYRSAQEGRAVELE